MLPAAIIIIEFTRMKVLVVLVALLSYSVSILDRSYYDALCTLHPT